MIVFILAMLVIDDNYFVRGDLFDTDYFAYTGLRAHDAYSNQSIHHHSFQSLAYMACVGKALHSCCRVVAHGQNILHWMLDCSPKAADVLLDFLLKVANYLQPET